MPLKKVVTLLSDICGSQHVFTDEEALFMYGMDQTLDLHFPFDILVKPSTAEQIAAILKICNEYKIPLTPRGGGSGVTGGALPVQRGVVLSLERLNRIITINHTDGYIIAESGVVTIDLCNAVAQAGFYFPVVPGSSASSFIGGNVAENAGSIHSCRYGTTSHYVLNLEVALPNGEIIWTGANVQKNVTGLNLTHLFIGSEGTLGVITKIVYRLLPPPDHEVSLLAAFDDLESAYNTVMAIKHSNLSPSATELISYNALQITAAYLDESYPLIAENIKAHLLIELQDNSEVALNDRMAGVAAIVEANTQEHLLVATTSGQKQLLWKLRYNIGNALKSGGKQYRDIDIVVPLSFLYKYITGVEAICERRNIPVACFGHAMDGNLHTMLTLNAAQSNDEKINFENTVQEIYRYAISNGGVISGEHGIGLLQKDLMKVQFSNAHLTLMKGIKDLLDPNGILNPGKIF